MTNRCEQVQTEVAQNTYSYGSFRTSANKSEFSLSGLPLRQYSLPPCTSAFAIVPKKPMKWAFSGDSCFTQCLWVAANRARKCTSERTSDGEGRGPAAKPPERD